MLKKTTSNKKNGLAQDPSSPLSILNLNSSVQQRLKKKGCKQLKDVLKMSRQQLRTIGLSDKDIWDLDLCLAKKGWAPAPRLRLPVK